MPVKVHVRGQGIRAVQHLAHAKTRIVGADERIGRVLELGCRDGPENSSERLVCIPTRDKCLAGGDISLDSVEGGALCVGERGIEEASAGAGEAADRRLGME